MNNVMWIEAALLVVLLAVVISFLSKNSTERFFAFRQLASSTYKQSFPKGLLLSLGVIAFGLVVWHTFSPGFGVALTLVGLLTAVIFILLAFFSVFTSVAINGVVIGVAALTAVLGVATGFEEQFRDKVLGVNAHVIIQKPDFRDYREVEKKARAINPTVIGVQPFIFTEMLVTDGRGLISGVHLKGIIPERASETLDLQNDMVEGSIAALGATVKANDRAPIIIARSLQQTSQVKLGSAQKVEVPKPQDDCRTRRADLRDPR